MRIISNFKDYYDSALAHGSDTRVVFMRDITDWEYKDLPVEWDFLTPHPHYLEGRNYRSLQNKKCTMDLYPVVIAFCGKIYRGIGALRHTEETRASLADPLPAFFYDYDDLGAYLDRHDIELNTNRQDIRNARRYKRGQGKINPIAQAKYLHYKVTAQDWLDVKDPTQYQSLLIERKAPIVIASRFGARYMAPTLRLELNTSLGAFQFFKVFDAYRAFQELDMFIAGTISHEDTPMAGIDDRYLAEAKGYNKRSFRKDPIKGN